MNEAKVFSKLGLAQGYHQIVFDEKSRDITTLLHFKDYFDINAKFFVQKICLKNSRKLLGQASRVTLTVRLTLVLYYCSCSKSKWTATAVSEPFSQDTREKLKTQL